MFKRIMIINTKNKSMDNSGQNSSEVGSISEKI